MVKLSDHQGMRNYVLKLVFMFFSIGATVSSTAALEPDFVTAVEAPIRSLFPPTTSDASTEPATTLLFETLLEPSWENTSFLPRLAKKWQVSKDKRTYTFWLDPAARFWDGTRVTPEDVQFSLKIYELPGLDTEPWSSHYLFIDDVKTRGKDQVVVTVQSPRWTHFVAIATMKIYQKRHYMKLYAADQTLRGDAAQKDPMGTGPWRVERFDPTALRLLRDPQYWDRQRFQRQGRWTYQRRTLRYFATSADRVAALQRGELSYLNLTKEDWLTHQKTHHNDAQLKFVQAENSIPQAYDCIVWNHKHPALYAAPTRWAMAHLIDLAGWIDRYDASLTRPTLGILGPRPPFDDGSLLPPRMDLSEAARRLQAAGWRTNNGLMQKNGIPLEVEIVYPQASAGQYQAKLAEMAAAGKQIGVRIIPVGASWDDMQKRLASGNFGGIVLSWSRKLHTSIRRQFDQDSIKEGDNFGNFRSDRMSLLMEQYDTAFDAAERQRLGRALQKLIYTLQPWTFLSEYRYTFYARDARLETQRDTWAYQVGIAFWHWRQVVKTDPTGAQ